MKLSNLALRIDPGTEHEAAEAPAAAMPTDEEVLRESRRLARTRALGLEYRAIVIRDDGLRPFRLR